MWVPVVGHSIKMRVMEIKNTKDSQHVFYNRNSTHSSLSEDLKIVSVKSENIHFLLTTSDKIFESLCVSLTQVTEQEISLLFVIKIRTRVSWGT
jgi:hypothetical protein